MADPIIIPEMPGGWCQSQETLTTFVELVNLQFQLIVDTYNETFGEELVLPGVPPVTIYTPGTYLPGVSPYGGTTLAGVPKTGQSYTGNRFPWVTGGDAKSQWEFPGFPALEVPGGSFTIGGRDPMTVVMESVRVNYEIIVKELEGQSVTVPAIDWTTTFVECDTFNAEDFNKNVTTIIDNIGDADPDGPPRPGSDIPDFGAGSGGPGSCWTITGDYEMVESGGFYSVVFSDAGGGGTISLNCDCIEADTDGGDWSFSWTSSTQGSTCTVSCGGYNSFGTITAYSNTDCTGSAGSDTDGVSLGCGAPGSGPATVCIGVTIPAGGKARPVITVSPNPTAACAISISGPSMSEGTC